MPPLTSAKVGKAQFAIYFNGFNVADPFGAVPHPVAKVFFLRLAFVLFVVPSPPPAIAARRQPVDMVLFYGRGCPHCVAMREYLDGAKPQQGPRGRRNKIQRQRMAIPGGVWNHARFRSKPNQDRP